MNTKRCAEIYPAINKLDTELARLQKEKKLLVELFGSQENLDIALQKYPDIECTFGLDGVHYIFSLGSAKLSRGILVSLVDDNRLTVNPYLTFPADDSVIAIFTSREYFCLIASLYPLDYRIRESVADNSFPPVISGETKVYIRKFADEHPEFSADFFSWIVETIRDVDVAELKEKKYLWFERSQ
jgi:hypothetical protein